jgi:hypothetical protein
MKATDLPGALWHKSSRSNGQANCVEVASNLPDIVAVRDSKDPDRSVLIVTREEWRGFIKGVKAGELGL